MTYSPTRRPLKAAAAALLLGALPTLAQAVPSDAVLKEFRPNGDYTLVVDGKDVPNAEIYLSERVPAFLILSSRLTSPVMLSVRTQTAETVQLMKVSKQGDGTVNLLADATLAAQGPITVGADKNVSFTVDKHPVLLRTRSPLLGLHVANDLRAYSPPIYINGAKYYHPDNQMIAALKRAYAAFRGFDDETGSAPMMDGPLRPNALLDAAPVAATDR